ncbi:MAG TPA: M3 family oligoendopeptidase [Thermotogota bacterium]|nr:M3 family oligoendopeptidase [Thermotogota bacterium]HPR95187.1 M3 family oligoendopeptidase [Thermotogota bacterium]
MKFTEFGYKRPDFDTYKMDFEKLLADFEVAETAEKQNAIMKELNDLRRTVETMGTLCHIRYDVNTEDKFYEAEQEYFDQTQPLFQELVVKYYKAILESKFRKELEGKWGKHLFNIAEMELKTFKPEIIEDLQEENKLCSDHTKLIASAKIMFDGEERNLSQMRAYFQNKDRTIRKAAYEAYAGFFEAHEKELDELYDNLVKVRTRMARKLGYETFTELGYIRLGRSDYNAEMVKGYRDQVYESVVPIATKLLERQAARLGYDKLRYYDEPLKFTSGNADPKGTPEEIMANGLRMYDELSKETADFFTFMTEHGLFDVLARKGKMGGGYCTFLPDYKAPFIFANFNGTAGDVEVLTHEAGHAFQVFSSRNYEAPEYVWPTLEACEIHSMSMEFFTYPWMQLFFEDEMLKHRFSHLSEAILFLPYGVSVDEYQHFVYENPEATPDERKAKWREIEKKYLPLRDYEDNKFYEKGTMWFRQSHIFEVPFYYIDYTLAQVCAFQFYNKMNEDREQAWKDYQDLCNAGGSKPFLQLLEVAKIKNPFVDGTVAESVARIEKSIEAIDDSKW